MPNQSKKHTHHDQVSGDQLSTLRTLIHPTAFKQELPRIIDRGMRTKPENPVDTDLSTVYQRYQDEETAKLLGELNLLDHPGHDRGHGLPAAAAPLLALRRCQFGRHDGQCYAHRREYTTPLNGYVEPRRWEHSLR